jgi:hypothetical protein
MYDALWRDLACDWPVACAAAAFVLGLSLHYRFSWCLLCLSSSIFGSCVHGVLPLSESLVML